jgi:hypothetical protein
MTEIDNKQILQEIMGTFVPDRPRFNPNNMPNPGEAQMPRSTYDVRTTGVNASVCSKLETWQRNIVDTLSGTLTGTPRDQYVIARPGGGKTSPVICHWTQNLLGLNTMALGNTMNTNINPGIDILFSSEDRHRVQAPKILFLVPVIVLAQQTGMEIRKLLATMMVQMFDNAPDFYINKYLRTNRRFRINDLINDISNYNDNIEQVNTVRNFNLPDRDGRNINFGRYQNTTPRIQEALNNAKRNLRSEVENCITDMVNEMVWIQTAQSNQQTNFNRALVFVSIYESAPGLINRINRLGGLRLTIIDEAHLIQESGIEDDDNQRAYQIMGSLFTVLKAIRDNRDNRIAMLSGTINPNSARNVTEYFNECFGRNFIVPTSAPAQAANRTPLAVIANNNLNDMNGVLKYIMRNVAQRDWGQLYVIFSTPKIIQLAKDCVDKLGIKNAENMSPAGYSPSNVFSGLGIARQNRSDYSLGSDAADRMSIPRDKMLQVSNITNPLLRQCVLRGVGFICRKVPGESFVSEEANLNDDDKLIVSKLFRERKISVLLATDAVGIGVNIDVKDLYIPKVEKFSSAVGTQVKVTLRDLSQILNRAGRGNMPIASIQTAKENVEMVSNALYANPEDLPDILEIRDRSGINPCDSRSFINFLNNVGRFITGARTRGREAGRNAQRAMDRFFPRNNP